MGRVQDKVAIITGGAKGIGFVASNTFSREGASVVIVDMDAVAAGKGRRGDQEQRWKGHLGCRGPDQGGRAEAYLHRGGGSLW